MRYMYLWENSGPPFWDLKIGNYVEYLMPVSSECIKSWVLLSPTSTAGQTSRVLLAVVILWINKTSLALYSMHHAMTDLKFGSYTALSSSSPVIEASKLVPVEVESQSQTPSLRLRCQHWCGVYYIIDDLLLYAPLELCSYWECGQVFHIVMKS